MRFFYALITVAPLLSSRLHVLESSRESVISVHLQDESGMETVPGAENFSLSVRTTTSSACSAMSMTACARI